MANLLDLFLHRNYVHSDAHIKGFETITILEESTISTAGMSLAHITESTEIEIRSPPLLIRHQYRSLDPKFPITINTTGRNEVLKELSDRLEKGIEFIFLLRYPIHMEEILNTLINASIKVKKLKVYAESLDTSKLPTISLFLTTAKIDPIVRASSGFGTESKQVISVMTSNIPMWLVELTDIMFSVSHNSKSSGIVDRSFQSSIDIRYTTILRKREAMVKKGRIQKPGEPMPAGSSMVKKVVVDKLITYSQVKQPKYKATIDEIKYSKNIESIPVALTPDEGEEFYRVKQSSLRRILNRQVFTNSIKQILSSAGLAVPLDIQDTNLVIYISDVVTIGTNAKNIMKTELEFELSSEISSFISEVADFLNASDESERTTLDIEKEIRSHILRQILFLIKMFSETYIAPNEIIQMFSRYYNSVGKIRQRPVDLDNRNGVSIHSESTGAFLTNKLDGVRRLLILHARHIYLVWKEINRIRYRLIGYDKNQVLGKICIVLDTEFYETNQIKYIGVFDVLSQDSCAELILPTNFERIETFLIIESGKKLVKNINESGALSDKYILEFKPHIYITNPRDISQYIKAASQIRALSKGMKIDGYILISDIARTSVVRSSRAREALDKPEEPEITLPVPTKVTATNIEQYLTSEARLFPTATTSKVPVEAPKQFKTRTRYNSIFKVKTEEDYTIDLYAGDERFRKSFNRILMLLERLMNVKYTSLLAPGAFEEMVKKSNLVISANLVKKGSPFVYRYDKDVPNDNMTIENVLKVVALRKKNKTIEQYLRATLGTKRPIMYEYHNGCKNKLIGRAYTISMAMNSIQTPGDISVDIGSGRGGDLYKIMANSSKIILLTEPNEQFYSGRNGLLHRIRNYKRASPTSEEMKDERIKLIRFELLGKIIYTARVSTYTNIIPRDKETPDDMSEDVIDWELRTKLKSRTIIGQLVEVIMSYESLVKVNIRNVFAMSTVTVLDNRTGARESTLPLNPSFIGNKLILIIRDLMKLSTSSIILTIFGFDGVRFFKSQKQYPNLPKGVGFKVVPDPTQPPGINPLIYFNTKNNIIKISRVNRKWLERKPTGIQETGKYYQATEISIYNILSKQFFKYEESLINFKKYISKIMRGYGVTIAYNAWASEKTGSMDPAEDLFSAFNFGIILIYHK